MGMFDTIKTLTTDPIQCPGCQTYYTEFQTKDLDNFLDEYCEGSTKHEAWVGINQKKMVDNPHYRVVNSYEWCKQCEGLLYQYFEFDGQGLLQRLRNPRLEITFKNRNRI